MSCNCLHGSKRSAARHARRASAVVSASAILLASALAAFTGLGCQNSVDAPNAGVPAAAAPSSPAVGGAQWTVARPLLTGESPVDASLFFHTTDVERWGGPLPKAEISIEVSEVPRALYGPSLRID